MKPVYLDYNATTPIDPAVLEAMLPYLKGSFGNPSSDHYYGAAAKNALSRAREQVAYLVSCEPDEVFFTSGGSESNNLAIKGAVDSYRSLGDHIITSKIEHPAVLEVFGALERQGIKCDYIDVDEHALIDLECLKDLIGPRTVLVSLMHSNNEVGTIQPVSKAASIAKGRNILFHCDAAQSIGKINVDFKQLGIDLLSIAGHKLYAPKGIGALIVKRGVRLSKMVHGAGHERGIRAGTENVPSIVALGKACEIAKSGLDHNTKHMKAMRDMLYKGLSERIEGIVLNGHPVERLPNTLSVSFTGINANTLLGELKDIAASPGAACHYESEELSYVLKAMGVEKERGFSTIRFSVGRQTTTGEIKRAIEVISEGVRRLGRKGSVPLSGAESVKLTEYTHGLGCACKIKAGTLEKILKKFTLPADKRILVGLDTNDDAAVYKLDDERAIVQTVDFFTPVVDDPFCFGQIAVANSLSDIYAMGADPIFALNIVAFPSKRLELSVLERIMEGAHKKALEAGISIIGGHTIDDDEPKYGLAVSGIVHPDRIFKNSGARQGDVLILTKPIGTGIISTAIKQGTANAKEIKEVSSVMKELNRDAAEAMRRSSANACTDITGFGLLGHALEMARAGNVSFELNLGQVPLIEGVERSALMGNFPGGSRANLEHVKEFVLFEDSVDEVSRLVLADAQTSGGLLISIPESESVNLLEELIKSGVISSKIIGRVTRKKDYAISVRA